MELPSNEKCVEHMNELIEQLVNAKVRVRRKRKWRDSEKAMHIVNLEKRICVLENARKETYEQST